MLGDKEIREPLFEFLEETFGKNRIIEEKQIGKSRADIMMVLPEALCGIEIKSDKDTYARLERQVKDYNRFFDYNIIAIGVSHAESIEEHVPEYWGIITVEEGEAPDCYMLRQPQRNPKREKEVLFRNQMAMLWRPELAHIQEMNGMHKYKQLSKINVIKKIMATVPREQLKRQLCDTLFERDYTTISEVIASYKEKENSKENKDKK